MNSKYICRKRNFYTVLVTAIAVGITRAEDDSYESGFSGGSGWQESGDQSFPTEWSDLALHADDILLSDDVRICTSSNTGDSNPSTHLIQCPTNSLLLIQEVYYGIKHGTEKCSSSQSVMCKQYASLDKFAFCLNSNECHIPTTSVFLDNCGAKSDFIQLEYRCLYALMSHTMCERSSLNSRRTTHGYLFSPGYPTPYRSEAYCECNLRTRDNAYIVLQILDFSLDEHEADGCYGHSLTISDDDSGRFNDVCGTLESGFTLYGSEALNLSYYTYGSSNYRGFWIYYYGEFPSGNRARVNVECHEKIDFGESSTTQDTTTFSSTTSSSSPHASTKATTTGTTTTTTTTTAQTSTQATTSQKNYPSTTHTLLPQTSSTGADMYTEMAASQGTNRTLLIGIAVGVAALAVILGIVGLSCYFCRSDSSSSSNNLPSTANQTKTDPLEYTNLQDVPDNQWRASYTALALTSFGDAAPGVTSPPAPPPAPALPPPPTTTTLPPGTTDTQAQPENIYEEISDRSEYSVGPGAYINPGYSNTQPSVISSTVPAESPEQPLYVNSSQPASASANDVNNTPYLDIEL